MGFILVEYPVTQVRRGGIGYSVFLLRCIVWEGGQFFTKRETEITGLHHPDELQRLTDACSISE